MRERTSPRRAELSVLNVLFCLMVVFIHIASKTLTDLDSMSWAYLPVLMVQRLCCIAVPGFFFLSGLKLTLPSPAGDRTLSQYYLARVRRLLVPYLLAAAVHYLVFIWLGWFSLDLGDFFRQTLRGRLSAQFYFIIALFQFTLLSPLFRMLARRYSPVVLLPPALVLTQISGPFFGALAQAFPNTPLPYYSGSVCTNFLFYYLAGCCAGAHYDAFQTILRESRPLIFPLALCTLCADQLASVLHYSGRLAVPFLDNLHLLYYLTGVLLLCALPAAERVSPLLGAVDRASYLIYLYHCLVITLFNIFAPGWGITRASTQFFLRLAVTYGVSLAGCLLWQWGWRNLFKEKLP